MSTRSSTCADGTHTGAIQRGNSMRKRIMLAVAVAVTAVAIVGGVSANLAPKSKAPNFTLPTLDGKKFTLSDHQKKNPKVIVLDVWATWCGPCRGAVPHMIDLHNKIKKSGGMVVGVATDAQKETVASFAKEKKINYTVALDPNGAQVARAYQVRGIPAIFIIDKKGVVRHTFSGFPSDPAEQKKEIAEMERAVKALLKEK